MDYNTIMIQPTKEKDFKIHISAKEGIITLTKEELKLFRSRKLIPSSIHKNKSSLVER